MLRHHVRRFCTIYALSSGSAQSAVSIVRLSGSNALPILKSITRSSNDPTPRMMHYRKLYHPLTNQMVDHALAVFFKGPHSATGEDMAEFHIHGSRAVQKLLFDAFQHFGGTRPAAPGEFTKRALEYGKMDLVQAEALSDLLKSDTLAQHQQALRNVEGHLSQRVEVWRKTLISCMAHVQAAIDFGEDDVSEVPPDVLQYVEPRLESLLVEMQQSLHAFRAAQTIRDGLSVAIVGAPNAGKSSLLNRLSRRDAAIVSHIAGTTRDVVSVSMEISGLAVNLMDTAGIRETSDPIEAEGVKRAVKAAASSDILILVVDATSLVASDGSISSMDLHKIIMPQDVRSLPANVAKILVLNKWDLLPAMSESLLASCFELGFKFVLPVSCQSGEGVPGLLDALGTLLAGSDSLRTASANEVALITRERHRYHVEACCGHMRTFLAKVRASQGQMDILSEELRLGAMELGAITGSIGVEEVLDVIFRDFCIGK